MEYLMPAFIILLLRLHTNLTRKSSFIARL